MSTALFTDLYELTMAQSYLEHRKTGNAVFSLFVRRLPKERNFLVSCGLQTLVEYLANFQFTQEDIVYLRSLNKFSEPFLDYLGKYRFHGKLYAIPEGRIVFQNEPLIQVEGSLPEVQILETLVINVIHFQTLIAAKAARNYLVGRGKLLVDFGLRRSHMPLAGIFAARAAYIAGFDGTSDIEAGRRFKIPVFGTMAHSYVMAFSSEEEAFRAFAKTFPKSALLLIDTYDTLVGAHIAAKMAREGVPITGVRIDSGDIPSQVVAVRKILNEAGLSQAKIFISSGVDEYSIDSWLCDGLPIDAFGVGTHFITSSDIPYLDMAYKLTEYEGQPKFKTSPGKVTFPFKRQIVRAYENGMMVRDETLPMGNPCEGETLVELYMDNGEVVRPVAAVKEIREIFLQDVQRLPLSMRGLKKEEYSVVIC
ncbi:MAG: nicotinate phosphoribosyltransferase [Firmicutes bacterium]|nr:nicotinate phosphoribosyltransferase [Bacillota bacterium]